jgi:hypothetical protein
MHRAAKSASFEVVKLVSAAFPEALEEQTLKGQLPLHLAAKGVSFEVVDLLTTLFPQALEERTVDGLLPLHRQTSELCARLFNFSQNGFLRPLPPRLTAAAFLCTSRLLASFEVCLFVSIASRTPRRKRQAKIGPPCTSRLRAARSKPSSSWPMNTHWPFKRRRSMGLSPCTLTRNSGQTAASMLEKSFIGDQSSYSQSEQQEWPCNRRRCR